MFHLTNDPIDPDALRRQLDAAETGALTVFEGRVRNHHLGRPVTRLDYEAFDELACREGEAIVAEAEATYPGTKALCVHRTGSLGIGEIAVWIGVASPHRQAGFAACRQVIEEIKRRLPVWKKEHHPDGAAEWVNCATEAAAGDATSEYYARQIALPEIGAGGQARLAGARVAVIGIGGLGCPAALYLAGAGVGRLTLVDGGRVELSNLARQVLFTSAEIGSPKALAAAARLRLHNPAIEVAALNVALSPANAASIVAGHAVVLDCTDNFAARFLLHDACRAAGIPLVSAAVHRFEGELNVFLSSAAGCLHCLWAGASADRLDAAGNCAGGPVFAPTVGLLGIQQAAEALQYLLGLDSPARNHTRLVDLLQGSTLHVMRVARQDCPVCSRTLAANTKASADVFIDRAGLAALPSASTLELPDSGEIASELLRIRTLAETSAVVLTCRAGIRSAALARLLRAEGLANVYALAGDRP